MCVLAQECCQNVFIVKPFDFLEILTYQHPKRGYKSDHTFGKLNSHGMYSGGGGTPRKSKTCTGYLARPKLGALKNIYANAKSLIKPQGGYGFDKKKKTK